MYKSNTKDHLLMKNTQKYLDSSVLAKKNIMFWNWTEQQMFMLPVKGIIPLHLRYID